MLAVNPNGWHHTMSYNGSNWQWIEGNGSGQIHWWNISSNDRYVSGDFNADGRDELLAINPSNGWHHTIRYNGSSWQWIEGDGSGQIHWWNLSTDDKYLTGDFDGDGKDDLLAINPSNGWHHTMEYNGSSWQWVEGNVSGQIHWWNLAANDKYVVGDFNGDGKDNLLAINPNGWHHLMSFNGSSWQHIAGGSGGQIHWWNISSADKFVGGDFNDDGQDELLAINPSNGWSHTMRYNGSSFQFLEGNDGGGRMGFWIYGTNDWYIPGKYDGGSRDLLMGVNPNGWWHMMNF